MKTLKIIALLAVLVICNLTTVAQETKTVRDFPEKKTFVGVHAGFGAGLYQMYEEYTFYGEEYSGTNSYSSYYGYLSGNVGVDVAIPVTPVFYIGPYASIGTDIEEFVFGSGVTMMFNFKNKSAIMVSYGLNFYQSPDRWLGSSERISYKFPNRLYLGIETLSSTTTWSYDGYDAEYFSVLGSDNSISVLFHLGFKLF